MREAWCTCRWLVLIFSMFWSRFKHFLFGKNPLGLWKWTLNTAISDLWPHAFRYKVAPLGLTSGATWSWFLCSPPDVSGLTEGWYQLIPKLETSKLALNFHLSTHPISQQIMLILLEFVSNPPPYLHPSCLHRPLSVAQYFQFALCLQIEYNLIRYHSVSLYAGCLT